MALRAFQPYIYGMKVIVHSDHRPLIYLMTRKGTHPNLARWAVELMQYDLYIEHVAGKINSVADCLSRIADELPENDVRHLPDAEDIINFPISLYCAEQTKTKGHCMMNADNSATKENQNDNNTESIPKQEDDSDDESEDESSSEEEEDDFVDEHWADVNRTNQRPVGNQNPNNSSLPNTLEKLNVAHYIRTESHKAQHQDGTSHSSNNQQTVDNN